MNVQKAIPYLRREFGKVQRMSDPTYERLCRILDKADDDALLACYRADIPFVSSLASNRLIRRGIHPLAPGA